MLVTLIKERTVDGMAVSLTVGQSYEVLGIEADDYRVLTDPGTACCPNDPVLYPPDCFRIVDPTEPPFWVTEYGEDGECYSYPERWSRAGFFEDFHDGVEAIRSQFWADLRSLYPRTWQERCADSKEAPGKAP